MIIKHWKRVFLSIYYFIKLIFIAKEYDVVFVSSTSFNRDKDGKNNFFKPMIEYCIKNDINYIVFEETYFKIYLRLKLKFLLLVNFEYFQELTLEIFFIN